MRHLPLLLTSLLALGAASCSGGGGGSSPQALTDAGYTALNNGDHEGAKKSFEEAAAGLEAGDPLLLDAKLGMVRAQAHIDSGAGVKAFEEFEKANRDKLNIGNYTQVASEFASAKAYVDAAKVLNAAKAAYPETDKLDKLVQDMGTKAEQAGDAAAVAAFKGLGYVGGD